MTAAPAATFASLVDFLNECGSFGPSGIPADHPMHLDQLFGQEALPAINISDTARLLHAAADQRAAQEGAGASNKELPVSKFACVKDVYQPVAAPKRPKIGEQPKQYFMALYAPQRNAHVELVARQGLWLVFFHLYPMKLTISARVAAIVMTTSFGVPFIDRWAAAMQHSPAARPSTAAA